MNAFQSLREYEVFVYTLPQSFSQILRSTLVVAQRGRLYAEVTGEIVFPDALASWCTSVSPGTRGH